VRFWNTLHETEHSAAWTAFIFRLGFVGNPEVENQFRVARYWKFPEDDQAQEATAISNGK